MYCPHCRVEYQEGATVCADCGAALTSELPPAPPEPHAEWIDLETVLETSDPALLPVVRSAFEAAGIPCFARGEMLQEFMGVGRFAGTNLITGVVELQVPRERGDEARALLEAANIAGSKRPPDDAD